MSLMDDLKKIVDGEIASEPESLTEVSGDFGRLIHRTPAVIVRPRTAESLAKVLRYANEQDVPVSTRGEAHTQTGQSLVDGGIVISTRLLNRILEINKAEQTATVEGGVVWGDLVKEADAQGLVPRVLTNNLGVTIGGTLSVAGLGVASFRYGAQGDNVEEIEAVTPTGEVVTCSPHENHELFDLIRSGMGQFGVITRARIRLRERLPQNRTYMLLYDSLEAVMADSRKVMSGGCFDSLESWCVPLPVGFKAEEGRKRAFGEWFFPLHLTKEFAPGQAPKDQEILEGLSPYRKSHIEDRSALDFAFRLEPLFELWKRGPYWGATHPWMEAILPWESATFYVKTVLEKIPPPMLGGGHILLWPSSGVTSSIPLFKRPAGEYVLGFGILPGIPRQYVDPVLEALDKASAGAMMMGGKRYLSGWIRFTRDHWRQHWGESWKPLCEAKRKYDPKGLLNPGFIDFE
jgi:FAD/FMN-containing dehydrogenase